MAAHVFVFLLPAAAEAFGKQLAVEIGGGIVETLFNQKAIHEDLARIKLQLEDLSEFLRTKLPALIGREVKESLAQFTQFDVAEKARTIKSSIATLEHAAAAHASDEILQGLISELVGHADAVFERGGTLIEYGQPYYASVGIAFGAGFSGYTAALKFAPERLAGLRTRVGDWRARLLPWVDASLPNSLSGNLARLQTRHALGERVYPLVDAQNPVPKREFVLSWVEQEPNRIFANGAWFEYWSDRDVVGNKLGSWLPHGKTFAEASAEGSLPYAIPEWWEVKEFKVPEGLDFYTQAARSLSSLMADYFLAMTVVPRLTSAVAVVKSMLDAIEVVITNARQVEVAGADKLQLAARGTADGATLPP